MKITRARLQKIIREEIETAVVGISSPQGQKGFQSLSGSADNPLDDPRSPGGEDPDKAHLLMDLTY